MCPPSSGPRSRRKGPAAPKATKGGTARKGVRQAATEQARRRAEGLIQPNIHVVTRDPLRVQILSTAMVRAIGATEFAEEVEIPYSTANYHFRVLREAGFLETVKEVSLSGAAKRKLYRATRNGFISEAEWGQVKAALRPGVAGAILQDFNGRVSEAIETETMFTRDDATLYWIPRLLDEKAYVEQMKAIYWIIEFGEQLECETVERRANRESTDADCITGTFAVAAFPSPTPDQVSDAARKGKRGSAKTLKKSHGNTGKSK